MTKTIQSNWGKMVKAKVEIEMFAFLPEGDKRTEIPDDEAALRIKNELCVATNHELVQGANIKLINQQ